MKLAEVNCEEVLKPFVSFGARAFFHCTLLSELPNVGVETKSIGDSAFEGSGVVSADLTVFGDDNIIGVDVFKDCQSLKTCKLPRGMTFLPNGTFDGCSCLETVEDLSGIREYGARAFKGCVTIRSIEFTSSTVSIGDSAFEKSGLSTVDLDAPGSIETIGVSVFKDCDVLTKCKLLSKFDYVPDGMFDGCSNLEIVEDLSLIVSYGARSFSGCLMLKNLAFNTGTAFIGQSAFEGSGLRVVNMKELGSIETLGAAAFRDCDLLTDFTLPSSTD